MNPCKHFRKLISLFLLASLPATAFASSYYWVGNSGHWYDYANHWATTSGGNVFHSQEPTITDDVYFDANSFTTTNSTVDFLNDTVYCHNMDWTGVHNNTFFNAPSGLLHVGGSLILTDTIFIQYPFAVSFEATTPGQVFNTGLQNFISVTFDGAGGSWTVINNLNCLDFVDVKQGGVVFNSAYMSVGGITGGGFISNSGLARSISLGHAEIYVETNWSCAPAGLVLSADSSHIIMQDGIGVVFDGGGQAYHYVDFINPGAVVNGNNFFDRVITYDSIAFMGNNSFDSLMIANISNPVFFQSGSTQTINLLMETNSAPSQIINIRSTTPGIQSTISLPAGHTICLNYVNLTDQNATGGGDFYAGSSSVNSSNNSGWQFTDCTPGLSAVWPGDANHDLIVDNFDVLSIATAYDGFGFVRPGGNNVYTAQPCMDWYSSDANNINYKYADSDGDMIIGETDTVAVSLNYGQTHPARLANPGDSNPLSGPDLYFQAPANVVPGSTISVPVMLGTTSLQAMNVYGIAFNVNYDTAIIVPGSVGIDYSGSWLAAPGNNIHIGKQFPSNGEADLGFARLNHRDTSGYGMIVTLTFQIKNNVSGYSALVLSHVRLISSTGIILPVTPVSSSIIAGVNEPSSPVPASVFPNPTADYVYVHLDKDPGSVYKIRITDITGKVIREEWHTGADVAIDIRDFADGTYLLTVGDENAATFRIVKQSQ